MTELLPSELKTLPHYLTRIIHHYRFHKDLFCVCFSIFIIDLHHRIESRHHIWRWRNLGEVANIMEAIIAFKKFFINWKGDAEKRLPLNMNKCQSFRYRQQWSAIQHSMGSNRWGGVLQNTIWNSKSHTLLCKACWIILVVCLRSAGELQPVLENDTSRKLCTPGQNPERRN